VAIASQLFSGSFSSTQLLPFIVARLGIGISSLGAAISLSSWRTGCCRFSVFGMHFTRRSPRPSENYALCTAETVLWRLSLVKEFDVDETQLRQLTQPVLVIASALDRLLPSITEARRLVKILPNAQMVVLPYSGHTCSEADIKLYEIMQAEILRQE